MDQIVVPTNILKKVERLSKELEAVKKEIKRAADRAIKEGKVHRYSSAEGLIQSLHS